MGVGTLKIFSDTIVVVAFVFIVVVTCREISSHIVTIVILLFVITTVLFTMSLTFVIIFVIGVPI